MKVAHFGSSHTHTHNVTSHLYPNIDLVSCNSVDEVFCKVASGEVEYGVVPAENSFEGVVGSTYDNLYQHQGRVLIKEEVLKEIDHYLVYPKNSSINEIKSHQQALAQCREWISVNVGKNVALTPVVDTVTALGQNCGLIVGSYALSLFPEDKYIVRKVDLDFRNVTKFFVIERDLEVERLKSSDHNVRYCTSICLTLKHEAGSLLKALKCFATCNINLTHIQSRPAKQSENWNYIFFITMEGFVLDASVQKVFELLEKKKNCESYLFLGTYSQKEII